MSADSVIVYRNKQWEHKIQKVKARDSTYQPVTGFLCADREKSISCLFGIMKETEVYT